MSYSQNDEENKIVEYFKGKVGRFLDIGAYDGKMLSNTLRLAELGWSGVCVEPSPIPFSLLKVVHKDNQSIRCVNALIGQVSGMVDFYDTAGDAVSTTDLFHKAKWEKGSHVKFSKVQAMSITAKDLLDQVGKEYDFVNIDTENTNLETLKAFVGAGIRFELLCIEHDNQHPAIVEMFPGCQPIYQNPENLIIYYKGWE